MNIYFEDIKLSYFATHYLFTLKSEHFYRKELFQRISFAHFHGIKKVYHKFREQKGLLKKI